MCVRPGRVQALPLLREREEGDRGTLERKPRHPQVQTGEFLLLRATGNTGLPGDLLCTSISCRTFIIDPVKLNLDSKQREIVSTCEKKPITYERM